jgi:membrane protein
MFKFFAFIKSINHFFSHKLWHIRINKLEGRKGFLIRQLRILSLAIKGFNEDKCLLKASALTFYMIFSVVPVLALFFGIAKGFGLQQKLKDYLLTDFSQYASILDQIFDYADKMLATTQGGLIAGIGVVLLLYTVLKLLSSVEDSFNEIWQIKKGRTLIRRITEYLAITLVAPVLIFASSGITIFIHTKVTNIESLSWFSHLDFAFKVFLKVISVALLGLMFTFIYTVLPNTRVKFKSAIIAGIITAIAFDLLQWGYIAFQVGVARYNAIYGSFAALPLFLVWVQYSWFIVLFGAELSFAYQNVDHYELESEIRDISVRYRRVISLLIANLVVKNFEEGEKPMNAIQIADKLDMPVRLARMIISDFVETRIFSEVKTSEEREPAYQPAMSENKLTVKSILDVLDTKGVNEMPIHSTTELQAIHRVMDDFDEVIRKNRENILVKNIL